MYGTLAEKNVGDVIDRVLAWVAEKLQGVRSTPFDPALRALFDLADPVLAAHDGVGLGACLDGACPRLGPFLHACVRLSATHPALMAEGAEGSLRWALQRAADRDDEAISELAALWELQRRTSMWLIEAIPGAKDAVDVALADVATAFTEVIKHEEGRFYVRAMVAVLALLRSLYGDVPITPWMRRALVRCAVSDLQRCIPVDPVVRTRGGFPWLVDTMDELGLWFVAGARALIEQRLEEPCENRDALRTLLERCDRSERTYLYFGDLRHTFEEHLRGAVMRDELRRRAVALDAWLQGREGLSALSKEWQNSVPDMVAELERMGFSRNLEAIRLSPEERARILSRAQKDRLARGGMPPASSELVAREVIASQRIEGIDARAFFREKGRGLSGS